MLQRIITSYLNTCCNAIAVAYITIMSKVPLPGLTKSSKAILNDLNMSQTKFSSNKNPFTTNAKWTPDLLKQISIVIDDPVETTSNFTRQRNPTNRYWKAQVHFEFDKFKQRIIKMADCDVPYIKATNYGSQFIVARLQKAVSDAIVAEALKKNIIITIQDKRAASDDNNWWTTINNIDGRIGTVDNAGQFEPKDLGAIFNKTQEGVKINFDVVLTIKLTTTDKRDKTSRDAFSLVADCSRGALIAVKQDIEAPQVETNIPQQPASKGDIAPQELTELIDQLLI